MAGGAQPHTLTSSATQVAGEAPTYNAYAYDVAGNTTQRQVGGVLQNLTWDPEGHLSNVAEGDEDTKFCVWG